MLNYFTENRRFLEFESYNCLEGIIFSLIRNEVQDFLNFFFSDVAQVQRPNESHECDGQVSISSTFYAKQFNMKVLNEALVYLRFT